MVETIVGFGSAPRRLLEELRRYVDHPNIYIFPEFFDDKKSLIQRRYAKYVENVYKNRDRIIIALWPDYLYDDRFNLCDLPIIWIFPLHSMKELEQGLPWCIEFVGYATQESLRDYTIYEYLDAVKMYGYRKWMLGANSREIYDCIRYNFDGVDITTLTIPSITFSDLKNWDVVVKIIKIFLENLVEGRVLRKKQILNMLRTRSLESFFLA